MLLNLYFSRTLAVERQIQLFVLQIAIVCVPSTQRIYPYHSSYYDIGIAYCYMNCLVQ